LIKEADFYEQVNVRNSIFSEFASFEGAGFSSRKTYFSENKFMKTADFNRAEFAGSVSFFQCEFNDKARFQKAFFARDAFFGNSKFGGRADFSVIRADETMLFNYAEFFENADFANAVFGTRTEFVQTKFQSVINLEAALFRGTAVFNKCLINKELNLKNAVFSIMEPEFQQIDIQANVKIIQDNTIQVLTKNYQIDTLKIK